MSSAATCPSRPQSRARGEESSSSPASTPHATCCDLSAPSVCGRPAGCPNEGKAGVDRGSPSSTRRVKTIPTTGRRRARPSCRHTHVGSNVVCCKFCVILRVIPTRDTDACTAGYRRCSLWVIVFRPAVAYSYVRALRDRGIKRSGPDLGARAAKRRDRPRGGPAAGPDERVSPSLHLARATMKHTAGQMGRKKVNGVVLLDVKSAPICCQPVLKTLVLRGNKSAGL